MHSRAGRELVHSLGTIAVPCCPSIHSSPLTLFVLIMRPLIAALCCAAMLAAAAAVQARAPAAEQSPFSDADAPTIQSMLAWKESKYAEISKQHSTPVAAAAAAVTKLQWEYGQ